MIKEFVIQNVTSKNKLTFGQNVNNDFIFDDGGVDWGTAGVSHSSYNFPEQIGESISSTTITDRDITITAYAFYIADESERIGKTISEFEEYIEKKVYEKKSKFEKIINPLQYVKIVIGDFYIEGKPSKPVSFGKTMKENNEYFCQCKISIYCNFPLFKLVAQDQTVLSGSIPKFRFPLVFPKNKGILFGIRRNYQLIAVNNIGTVPVGGVITLQSKGVVVNPKIENIYTGEFIRITKTMQAGEQVIIDTNKGSGRTVKGIIDAIEYNYFKYWDFESEWLQFAAGNSLIGYSTENDSEKLLSVAITLSPSRFSLEGM